MRVLDTLKKHLTQAQAEEDVPILVETTQAPFIIFDTENIPIFPYLKQRKEPEMKKLVQRGGSNPSFS